MRQDPKSILQRIIGANKPNSDDAGGKVASDTRSAAPDSRRGSRQLWGENFALVDNGLDPNHVVQFVEDLLTRYKRLDERGGSSASVNSYLQKVIGEINRVEETITTQIRHDAEAEAAKVIVDSREEARQIVTQARREAAEQAATETETIIANSRKKAEAAEGQVRLQVQLLMEKAQEQIQGYIRREGNDAYQRLLTALQGLSRETQQLEDQWKRQSTRIWETEDFRVMLDDDASTGSPESDVNG
ncbi:MAG: hypothetical protein IIC87_07800 [Chloroflexi bacterium]|nr:hypothetical protein [Chloroflexota bacterium]